MENRKIVTSKPAEIGPKAECQKARIDVTLSFGCLSYPLVPGENRTSTISEIDPSSRLL